MEQDFTGRAELADHPTSYSVVVPFHNEEDSVVPLHEQIVAAIAGRYEPFELIFVDDCSTDSTYSLLRQVALSDERVTVIKLKRNYGQTPALAAGFDQADGDVIVAMDGDLQHDPAEIPVFIDTLAEGYDMVSGWREKRVDNFIMRRVPSKIANWLMAKLSGVELHDFGTTYKAYRKETIKSINLYGELHRFIPALVSWNGARIAEVPITNIERPKGESHYGISRTVRVLFDLITLRFMLRYVTRPLHFFGPIGLVGMLAGGGIGVYLLVEQLLGVAIFAQHGALTMLAASLILAGIQLLSTGLVAELLARTYFESQKRRIYTVEHIVQGRLLRELPE
jgi:glycosyltransferase involved in cell wall biosynthesis